MPASSVVLLMGVAGSGKTTVGRELAASLGWRFLDGDDFHSPANVAKMAAGSPLTDADRASWLAALRGAIDGLLARGEGAVVACSALKERYRRALVADRRRVRLVYLKGGFDLIARRLREREGHYMKESLLASQFSDLEPPADAFALDVSRPPAELAAAVRRFLESED